MWLLTVFSKPQTLERPGEICQLSDPATEVERQIMRQANVGLLMLFVGNVVKWAILLQYVILKRNHSQLSRPTRPTGSSRTYYLETDQVSNSMDDLHLFAIEASSKTKPIKCEVTIEGVPLIMEVDTGAEVSIISEATRKSLFPGLKPTRCNVVLKTYTEEVVPIVGELSIQVQYSDQTKQLKLIVVSGDGPNLLGRNWLTEIQLNWQQIKI